MHGRYAAAVPGRGRRVRDAMRGMLPDGWDARHARVPGRRKGLATRVASRQASLNAIADKLPTLIGGSADLAPSNDTYLKDAGRLHTATTRPAATCTSASASTRWAPSSTAWRSTAASIPYGAHLPRVQRLHARLDPPRRAHARCHSTFVYTHDSIGLGEDGPTHQPIEHLAALRAMPTLTLIRPGRRQRDRGGWRLAIDARARRRWR